MGSVESQGRGRPRVGPQADWAVTSEERGRHKPWAPVDRGQSGCERSPWEQGTPPSEQDRGGATPVVLGWVSEEGHQEPCGVCHLRVSLTFGGAEPNSCWQGDPLEWARFLWGGHLSAGGWGSRHQEHQITLQPLPSLRTWVALSGEWRARHGCPYPARGRGPETLPCQQRPRGSWRPEGCPQGAPLGPLTRLHGPPLPPPRGGLRGGGAARQPTSLPEAPAWAFARGPGGLALGSPLLPAGGQRAYGSSSLAAGGADTDVAEWLLCPQGRRHERPRAPLPGGLPLAVAGRHPETWPGTR